MAPAIAMANPNRLTRAISSIMPEGPKKGFATGVGVIAAQPEQRYSIFSASYPKALSQAGITPGGTPGQFLGAYAARVLTDIGTDSSRHIYWRYNHPMALADKVVEKVAGKAYTELDPTQKALVGLSVGAPVAASLGVMDITNPGELFRPKGYAQSYAETGSQDRRETAQPGLEAVERLVLGRQGRPLKYETAKEDIPSLTSERYSRFMQNYYQDKGLGGLGLIKGTTENLEGYPEARIVGFPVGLQAAGALAGGTLALRQALQTPQPATQLGLAGVAENVAMQSKIKPTGRRSLAVAGVTLAGSMTGALAGNLINQAIAAGNRPQLPTTSQYQQGM
jgi:hypothetical protein